MLSKLVERERMKTISDGNIHYKRRREGLRQERAELQIINMEALKSSNGNH